MCWKEPTDLSRPPRDETDGGGIEGGRAERDMGGSVRDHPRDFHVSRGDAPTGGLKNMYKLSYPNLIKISFHEETTVRSQTSFCVSYLHLKFR